ncbi:hypothetical protein JCM11251_005758 [Rhodosporidiobolus azoricus]
MAYPPVPYPSVSSAASPLPSQPSAHLPERMTREDKQPTSTAPATPATKRTFRSPFKSPLVPRQAIPSSTASSAPTSTKPAPSLTNEVPASLPVTPIKARACPAVPFKSPALSSSTAASPSSSIAFEISQIERRLHHLRQARRYQQATQRGDKDGDEELERLCEKWKEAGKLAAEMLFERVGSPETADGGAFSFSGHDSFSSSWGFAASSTSKHPLSDPWSSSWGFSSSPPGSDPFGPSPFPSSSSFFSTSSRRPSTADLVSTFKRSVDEEARSRGMTVEKLLSEMDEFETEQPGGHELEDPEAAIERMLKLKTRRAKRSSGFESGLAAKRIKVGEQEEKEEDEEAKPEPDSDDELLDALDSLIGSTAAANSEHEAIDDLAAEEEELEEAADEEETRRELAQGLDHSSQRSPYKEWSVGELLKKVGVDPMLFGWSEEYEEFA